MMWDWIPGVRCGEFRFGSAFDAGAYSLSVELDVGDDEHSSYRAGDGEAYVSVSAGVIDAVECWSSLRYRSVEILGLPVAAVALLLGGAAERTDTWEGGSSWDLPALCVTLWEEAGVVESATVWAPEPTPE